MDRPPPASPRVGDKSAGPPANSGASMALTASAGAGAKGKRLGGAPSGGGGGGAATGGAKSELKAGGKGVSTLTIEEQDELAKNVNKVFQVGGLEWVGE